jgi:hypothetical protein
LKCEIDQSPVAIYGLPVGGLPNNGPVFVPLFVHLISTLSPFAKISSCTSFRSGTAAITADAYFFVPSGPTMIAYTLIITLFRRKNLRTPKLNEVPIFKENYGS